MACESTEFCVQPTVGRKQKKGFPRFSNDLDGKMYHNNTGNQNYCPINDLTPNGFGRNHENWSNFNNEVKQTMADNTNIYNNDKRQNYHSNKFKWNDKFKSGKCHSEESKINIKSSMKSNSNINVSENNQNVIRNITNNESFDEGKNTSRLTKSKKSTQRNGNCYKNESSGTRKYIVNDVTVYHSLNTTSFPANKIHEDNQTCTASTASNGSDLRVNLSPNFSTLIESPNYLKKFVSEWKELEQEDISSADYYFNSYAHFGIHEEMLKDTMRTGAYQKAILSSHHLFKDKVVLDIGCGTGILSFFAAKAGAKHVIGIECSEIIEVAKKISSSNNFDDKITFIRGKAEEVTLPFEKVDIIISEWMGYLLLYESMLDTVLFCRDKWLKPGGLIFPDKAHLYISAIEDGEYKEEKVGFWDNVYGFDYSCVKNCILEEPLIDSVDSNAIVATTCCILELDLNNCSVSDLNFCSVFHLSVSRKDFIHAFIAWFDITFSACHKPITFTTGPFGRYTHWKQTFFYIKDNLVANEGDILEGIITVKKNKKNPRELDIKLMYKFKGSEQQSSGTQYFRLR